MKLIFGKRHFIHSGLCHVFLRCHYVCFAGLNDIFEDYFNLIHISEIVKNIRLSTMKIVKEYDQEIQKSQTALNPWHLEEEPHNNHETPGRQTKQSNQLSLPYRDDCKPRMDTK